VILQNRGAPTAIHAFEQVLARDPGCVPAYKALGEVLLAARRIDDWLRAFDRFEARCPRALAVAVRALEVYAYCGDFAAIDRYLERLRGDDFVPESRTDLPTASSSCSSAAVLDIEPETHFAFIARTCRRTAGVRYVFPVAGRVVVRPRIGYLPATSGTTSWAR
jgi:hypothetical protein